MVQGLWVQGVGLGTRLGRALDPGARRCGGRSQQSHWLGAGRWVLRGLGRSDRGGRGGSVGPALWIAGHALGSMDLGVTDGPQEGVCGEWGRDPTRQVW